MKATLKFPSREQALDFRTAWAYRSLMGCDVSPTAKDGTVSVSIYNITDELKIWIDEKIATMNEA